VTPAVLTIARRFRGPEHSGNGGYVCGALAERIEPAPRAARVRLNAPPPLERELVIEREPGVARLVSINPIAQAIGLDELESGEAPAFVPFEAAEQAAQHFRGFHAHPYPGCFVCGPDRAAGDGLRIFPGPLDGDARTVAATWVPDASLAVRGTDVVAARFLWAALDCPGGFAFSLAADRAILLGELAVELTGDLRVGERCVVTGRELSADGRKHFVETALFGADGALRGRGRATWFEVPMTAADAAATARATR